jgi:acyl-CoA synthetase (AMP-forming)/AMP-acid ligase II
VTDTLLKPREQDLNEPATLGALLARSLAWNADAEALAMPGERLSYRQFDARVEAMAGALAAAGAGKGARIALLAPDSILWATAFFAATRIGAIVIAVSTLATAPELAHILRHSDTQILIGVRSFLRHDYVARLETAFPELRQAGAGPLWLADAPYLRSIWLDDADGVGWARSHADLLDLTNPTPGHVSHMSAQVVPSDDAVLIYTSGSSSLPKAVVHTQGSVTQHSLVLARYFRMKPEDRLMPLLPVFWIGGLTMLIEVLGSGGTVIYTGSPEPEAIAAAVTALGVNRINSWGPQVEKIRSALSRAGIDPDAIVGLGPELGDDGQPVPSGLAANMLGMTESFGPHSSEVLGSRLPEAKAGASGRVTSDYERRIVDPETGEIMGPNHVGELQLRRGGLMRTLYKLDPDCVFTPDGFYPTGDKARIDADGYLFFEGRRTDMIKTAGANVSRQEVEAALRQLPGVALPIVVPLNDEEAGQIVVAAVVPADGCQISEESLKAGLRELVASYKVPRRIVIILETDIEWTPSHKIKLAELARLITAKIGHETPSRS